MRLFSSVGVVLLAAGCAPKTDTQPGATAQAAPVALSAAGLDSVKAVETAFAAGMIAKDSAAVFDLYAPDARLMPPDSPILDGAAGHPVITGLMAGGVSDFVLTPTTAYGIGDLAYLVGTASFKVGGATETVKYVEVLRRGADGKWRYVVDMFSGLAAPARK